ncbi:MAG TPA: alpha/beta fold hydrolase [Usitatibacter sp.]|nr:alpha/beta fold hydrolase [Usitatibacter sp.]
MKRDDLDLAAASPAVDAHLPAVTRTPLYFGDGAAAGFGWYHHAPRAIARDCVAVLCPPIGPEYTRSHRTVRHLADRLARSGIAALRFDYHGVGDSPGGEDEPDRIGHWKRSIAAAVRHAREVSGCEKVCLVGLRLGATLAALDAEEAGADLVVLWNPVVKGRAYARELQAMAMTAKRASAAIEDGLESAGFRISADTLEALKAVDLTRSRFKPGARVLFVARDDLAGDRSFTDHLTETGIENEVIETPGWNAMMADHQFTVVPEAALDSIAGWIVAHSVARPALSRAPATECRRTLALAGLSEQLCRFGDDGHLFGIVTRPARESELPAVVMLNAGSIHHVGPHRLYVRLARELAEEGYTVLRLDHEGLGDSVPRPGEARENHPYPPHAIEDVQSAFRFLEQEHGLRRFILLGLCSGAHTAFHAARTLPDAPIEKLVLINPWYFYWSEGMSLDTSVTHYQDMANYQSSMRDPERWKKMLRGEVDMGRLARVVTAHVAKSLRGRWADVKEILVPSSGTPLSRDLRAIVERRPVTIYMADGEPAGPVLQTQAKRTVKRAMRAGTLRVEKIPGGDHTFSQSGPREDLIRRVRTALHMQPSPGIFHAIAAWAGMGAALVAAILLRTAHVLKQLTAGVVVSILSALATLCALHAGPVKSPSMVEDTWQAEQTNKRAPRKH